jgi:sulfur-carrier protein
MQVLFFGSLAEITGKTEFNPMGIETTSRLKEVLIGQYPELESHSFLIAVNKKVQHENTALFENDVVALLPPFSGG